MVEKRLKTKKGDVLLARDFSEEYIRCLGMGEGLGAFFHYRYEDAHKTRKILSAVNESDRLACAVSANCIIGYVALVGPEQGSRWDEISSALLKSSPALADPVLLELGSIEVSTPWRSMGLARELMRFMFEDPVFEEKIVISRELSWSWDLRSTGLTLLGYRSMLLRLFESAGFRYYETDDDEIGYAAENMLTARVGERIAPETALTFYRLLQKHESRGWGWG